MLTTLDASIQSAAKTIANITRCQECSAEFSRREFSATHDCLGIVPVVAQTAAEYGVPAEAIARAAPLGQPVHALSPLLAPIYLACGLLGVEVGDAQRFALNYPVGVSLIVIAAALLTMAIPLRV